MEKQKHAIHHAIKKYGDDSFEFSIIESCETKDMVSEREMFWIAYYKSNICKYGPDFGYNLTDGGDGGKGHNHSEESKIKMSLATSGKPKSEAHKKALSIAHTGNPLSDAHKKALGDAGRGRKHTEEAKQRCADSKLGDLNPQSKLTEVQVREIKNLFETMKPSEIAKLYGVAPRTIRDIKNHITWKHIE